MIKLSIIVPVYNTQNEMAKCLESILKQKNENIEILVINDGSTDSSKQVIQEYQLKYPNTITYYEKENTGIADTRNVGINKAKGKYILFVDSDDYLSLDFLKKLDPYMDQDIDIVKFKLQRVNEQGKILEKVDGATFEKTDGETAFSNLAFSDVLLDSPCVYLFKKELFTQNDLYFKIGTEHEDFGLIPLVLLKAKSIVSLDFYGYNYVQRNNSITRNDDYEKTKKRMQDVLVHYDHMVSFLEKEEIGERAKKNLRTYYTNAILLKLKELKRKEQDEVIKQIRIRNMIADIQVHNMKQWIKKIILTINIRWYLKLK